MPFQLTLCHLLRFQQRQELELSLESRSAWCSKNSPEEWTYEDYNHIGYEVPKVRMTEYQVFLKNTFQGRSQTDVFEQNKPIAFVQANLSENNAC